ncbi:MAG: hypothetical protein A2Z49_06970 [Chloroflexi bacterium RBG_19FT_COMBO_56_12]|nr:MAG: hypothetical protein A2Z49_06970 [Chloroflexi bacterium RBG_19FT_COMBO_56_12]
MTSKAKRELLEAIRPRYLRANKTGKERILDEFCAATGYHRKYAIRLLKKGAPPSGLKKSGRTKIYTGAVVEALLRIWEICGRICSRRLHPFLPEITRVLEQHQELVLPAEVNQLLLQMSRASIDRCLHPFRFEHPRGLSTTKPGALLREAIPVRTFTPWEDERPGFEEIDLVAHCGQTTEGQYLNTLTVTDLATGWTECLAILHKSQHLVSGAIRELRTRLPFPLLGIDSDNGSEFINDLLYRYCLDEQITFTRSRPYRKNDQAHVEQKNWSVVRHVIGYDRYETEAELAVLKAIYQDLRLYINFFQPVLKLIGKEQVDGKVIKRYDTATTPYQRVLVSPYVSDTVKIYLRQQYAQLNPVMLRNRIDANVAILWKLVK